jgi:hypothetical protein
MFKFNSGSGAIICDRCRKILVSSISPTDYTKFHRPIEDGSTLRDYCEEHKPDRKYKNARVYNDVEWIDNKK